ncbi:unnamed protein product [Amoebophrya sp. A120]|nr:unnamed protein product [Amoebophrya sp. A120]|eukprot:GSA120T00017182001.1
MADVWTEMFGAKLQGKDGAMVESSTLKNSKAVGIYFSAHWCPPCRGFTPKLAEWYSASLKEKGMEIVFVSSDRDVGAFDEYFAEQPWLSLPYSERETKDKLSKKFKVEGIPTFVILGSAGNIITKKGRECVSSDPTGTDFPWYPKSLKELLGTEFQTKAADGNKLETINISEFDGKKLGLYFSAHWCPPCRSFTPMLKDVYEKLKQKDEKFEIVFISSDREEEGFTEYFGEMPWKAIPYADRKRKQELSSHFEVSGIPSLIILDEERKTICPNAVAKVRNDKEGAKYPWLPELINEIDEDPEGIDEAPSIVVLQEKLSAEEKEKNKNALMPLAKKYREAATDGDQEFNFFLASTDGGELAERVRNECGENEEFGKAQVVLMDIQDRGGYYVFDKELTTDNVASFLADYSGKKLKRMQMGG